MSATIVSCSLRRRIASASRLPYTAAVSELATSSTIADIFRRKALAGCRAEQQRATWLALNQQRDKQQRRAGTRQQRAQLRDKR